jgi:hypothetical protein
MHALPAEINRHSNRPIIASPAQPERLRTNPEGITGSTIENLESVQVRANPGPLSGLCS